MKCHNKSKSENLKKWLSRHNLTHEQFSQMAEVAKSTVDGWCSNKTIGKKGEQKIKKAMEQYALRHNPSHCSRRLHIQNHYAVGKNLYTEEEWMYITLAAKNRRIEPGEYMYSALMSHIRRLKDKK